MLWQSRPGRWGPAEALAAAQARRAGCTTTSTTTCTCSCAAASAYACSRRPRPAACTRAGGRAWCTPTAASCTTGRRAARPPSRTRLQPRLSALHGRGRTGGHAPGTSTGAQKTICAQEMAVRALTGAALNADASPCLRRATCVRMGRARRTRPRGSAGARRTPPRPTARRWTRRWTPHSTRSRRTAASARALCTPARRALCHICCLPPLVTSSAAHGLTLRAM